MSQDTKSIQANPAINNQPSSTPQPQVPVTRTVQDGLKIHYENGEELVSINGYKGVLVNKKEIESFRGPVALNEYPINNDPNPLIIHRKSGDSQLAMQEIKIRYLEPPPLPAPGEIIIQQEPPLIPPQAPPIVLRVKEPSNKQQQVEKLIIRESPPKMATPIERKIIKLAAPHVSPPPRKLIIERLSSSIAEKIQPIEIERWLAPKQLPRRVIFNGVTIEKQPPVRNEIHEIEPTTSTVEKKFINVGVTRVDPNEYITKYGNTLVDWKRLPEWVRDIRAPGEHALASDVQLRPEKRVPQLVGDIHMLQHVDLNREGLGEYSDFLRAELNKLNQQQSRAQSSSLQAAVDSNNNHHSNTSMGNANGNGCYVNSQTGYTSTVRISTSIKYDRNGF